MIAILVIAILSLILFTGVHSFSMSVFRANSVALPSRDRTRRHRLSAERVNKIVELGSPKVVSNIALKAGESCAVCRCWKSKSFPLCDGQHAQHNKETGDNLYDIYCLCVDITLKLFHNFLFITSVGQLL